MVRRMACKIERRPTNSSFPWFNPPQQQQQKRKGFHDAKYKKECAFLALEWNKTRANGRKEVNISVLYFYAALGIVNLFRLT